MNYTSIEQSKRLLELGLSPESADMSYFDNNVIITSYNEAKNSFLALMSRPATVLPCWSVGALLEVIRKNSIRTGIFIADTMWVCDATTEGEVFTSIQNDSIIDAVFETIFWLLENNYIKKI